MTFLKDKLKTYSHLLLIVFLQLLFMDIKYHRTLGLANFTFVMVAPHLVPSISYVFYELSSLNIIFLMFNLLQVIIMMI